MEGYINKVEHERLLAEVKTELENKASAYLYVLYGTLVAGLLTILVLWIKIYNLNKRILCFIQAHELEAKQLFDAKANPERHIKENRNNGSVEDAQYGEKETFADRIARIED